MQNSFWVFFWSGFGIFLFLSWHGHHLPCICNSLELEPVILHGICYTLAWSLGIFTVYLQFWPCLPSILHSICHNLALRPLNCMVFATFWYFKHVGFLRSVSSGFRSGLHLGVSLGFHAGFHLGCFRVSFTLKCRLGLF